MNNNYTEQLIKTRLKILCIEKHIDYQWLGIPNPSFISINDSLNLRRSNGSISFLNIRNSSISNSGIQPPIIDNNNNNLSRISFADSNLFICPQTSFLHRSYKRQAFHAFVRPFSLSPDPLTNARTICSSGSILLYRSKQ